jgi:hypothetical protein
MEEMREGLREMREAQRVTEQRMQQTQEVCEALARETLLRAQEQTDKMVAALQQIRSLSGQLQDTGL